MKGMLGNFRAFDWNFRLHTLQRKWDKQYRQRVGTDMEKLEYEVGDIVRLKTASVRQQ